MLSQGYFKHKYMLGKEISSIDMYPVRILQLFCSCQHSYSLFILHIYCLSLKSILPEQRQHIEQFKVMLGCHMTKTEGICFNDSLENKSQCKSQPLHGFTLYLHKVAMEKPQSCRLGPCLSLVQEAQLQHFPFSNEVKPQTTKSKNKPLAQMEM